MKTILWMRHGKSDWRGEAGDHERPLAERGVRASRTMGRAMDRAGIVPDAVISSTAVRARTTAELACGAAGWETEIVRDRGFYESGVDRVLDVIRAHVGDPDPVEDPVDILLVVGHEPTWSGAVTSLLGGGSVRMVTAAVACVDLDIARWGGLRPGVGTLRWFLPPRFVETFGD